MNELIIEAKIENIDKVLSFVSEHLDDCSFGIQNQIEIAVDELFSNIARYAYNPTTGGGAAVRVAVNEAVTIEFEDSGVEYNPLLKEDPDVTLSDDERGIGGLGIFMVKNMMDSVEYRREGHKNILTIKKNLGS
ncbi:MAG: ATP-binding protein [Oscillospiraceae bacterium]|jgi:anti-sigma regulatory factor (Ser/Thr protein kinase)|nr:ATP-binding protein [Oscillospiraceae bacterium]